MHNMECRIFFRIFRNRPVNVHLLTTCHRHICVSVMCINQVKVPELINIFTIRIFILIQVSSQQRIIKAVINQKFYACRVCIHIAFINEILRIILCCLCQDNSFVLRIHTWHGIGNIPIGLILVSTYFQTSAVQNDRICLRAAINLDGNVIKLCIQLSRIKINFIVTELVCIIDREFGIYHNVASFIRKLHTKRYLLSRAIYFTRHQLVNINMLAIYLCQTAVLFSI